VGEFPKAVALDATEIAAARAAVLHFGEPASMGLELLARPKKRGGALVFLQLLARQFPFDPCLRRMLRQALDGRSPWRGLEPSDYEVYDLLHETDMRNRRGTGLIFKERNKYEDQQAIQMTSKLQDWLCADAERARRTMESLKNAHETTKKIDSLLSGFAGRYLARGATRVGALGAYFTTAGNHPRDLRGVMLMEDIFVQICRAVGDPWEVLTRFGPNYLPCNRGRYLGGCNAPGFEVSPGSGGPTVDCATRKAAADCSSRADGCGPEQAVDGNAFTGWCPELLEYVRGGNNAWWDADLGRLHSCVGVKLHWFVPVAGTLQSINDESKLALKDVKVKVSASKTDEPPSPADYEVASGSDELMVRASHGKESMLPALFVGRWVRLDFSGDWPKTANGEAFLVSVRVIKVWRLSPPPFRQRFLEQMRMRLKTDSPMYPNLYSNATQQEQKPFGKLRMPVLPFWASTGKNLGTHNKKIRNDMERYRLAFHDTEELEHELFGGPEDARQLEKTKEEHGVGAWEFHARRSKEIRAWRAKLYAKEDDINECTFHPRAAANVPTHVKYENRVTGDRHKAERQPAQTVDMFVKDIGTDFGGSEKYQIVRRNMVLSRARVQFAEGNFIKAQQILQGEIEKGNREFGLQSIMDRSICIYPGCKRPLDHNRGSKRCPNCKGYYCAMHATPPAHICSQMKPIIAANPRVFGEEPEGPGKEREEVPNSKKEEALILEVQKLAEAIRDARKAKARNKFSLKRLKESLSQHGAIRLMERPFKNRICETYFEHRSECSGKGSKVPIFEKRPMPSCSCPMAHKPAELRFPGGESVGRRAEWLKKGLRIAKDRYMLLPGSRAEMLRIMKPGKDDEEEPTPKAGLGSQRRARSEPRQRRVERLRQNLDDRAQDVNQAQNFIAQARGYMTDGNFSHARRCASEARQLASKHVCTPATMPLPYARQDEHPAVSPRRSELRSQILALAGSQEHAGDRNLRVCEDQALRTSHAVVNREVFGALDDCTVVEAELEKHRRARAQADEAVLRSYGSMRSSVFDDSNTGRRERTQMCVAFLDLGRCDKGENCPYAHNPGELTGRSQNNLEALLKVQRSLDARDPLIPMTASGYGELGRLSRESF
jgi:hypothetical protein